MRKIIICDIDDCLSKVTRRKKYLGDHTPDWHKFHNAVMEDECNSWCKEIIDAMVIRGYGIILVTSRPEKVREKTKRWLKKNFVIYKELYMRPDDDKRDSSEVKEGIYMKHIFDKYKVLFVLEDRKKNVDMWRRKGLVCLQNLDNNF